MTAQDREIVIYKISENLIGSMFVFVRRTIRRINSTVEGAFAWTKLHL